MKCEGRWQRPAMERWRVRPPPWHNSARHLRHKSIHNYYHGRQRHEQRCGKGNGPSHLAMCVD
eukprot:scaffold14281_cov68-Attheya_sp.AAC.4